MMPPGAQELTLDSAPREPIQVGIASGTLQVADELCWSPRVGTGRVNGLVTLNGSGDSSMVRVDPRYIWKPRIIYNHLSELPRATQTGQVGAGHRLLYIRHIYMQFFRIRKSIEYSQKSVMDRTTS